MVSEKGKDRIRTEVNISVRTQEDFDMFILEVGLVNIETSFFEAI